jgi:hypothetical protein
MPRPTDEQVRAYVDGQPPPSEAESLRRELDKMRERYLEAEERVSEARAAKDDHEEPWIWSDDDTAKTVDEFGNMMVVRITGGHLRALLSAAYSEMRESYNDSIGRILSLAFRSMDKADPVEVEKMTVVARSLCEEIAASKDPRIACDDRGGRRTPVEVSVSLFGQDVALAMWEGQ